MKLTLTSINLFEIIIDRISCWLRHQSEPHVVSRLPLLPPFQVQLRFAFRDSCCRLERGSRASWRCDFITASWDQHHILISSQYDVNVTRAEEDFNPDDYDDEDDPATLEEEERLAAVEHGDHAKEIEELEAVCELRVDQTYFRWRDVYLMRRTTSSPSRSFWRSMRSQLKRTTMRCKRHLLSRLRRLRLYLLKVNLLKCLICIVFDLIHRCSAQEEAEQNEEGTHQWRRC